jgi:hypothetical protein
MAFSNHIRVPSCHLKDVCMQAYMQSLLTLHGHTRADVSIMTTFDGVSTPHHMHDQSAINLDNTTVYMN